MVSRNGINISGHYVVSIDAVPFNIPGMYFEFETFETSDRTVFYSYYFYNSTTIRHGVLISGYVEFIPTVVSSK